MIGFVYLAVREKVLHQVWAAQRFERRGLKTTAGDDVQVLDPGTANQGSGPDFLDAHVKVGGVSWYGHVELHVQSSAWQAHKHHQDSTYDTVVLHVVWEEDKQVHNSQGRAIPTLVLCKRVQLPLEEAPTKKDALLCTAHFAKAPARVQQQMLARAWKGRKVAKVGRLLAEFEATGQDTEETTYRLLMYSLGGSINSETCLWLARGLPLRVLQKCRPNLHALEALLLGQAGLLPEVLPEMLAEDAYAGSLVATYASLRRKYRLQQVLGRSQWKFFRLRPASFPTLRLAQMAALLHRYPALFDWLCNLPSTGLALPPITQSSYWQVHYDLGKAGLRLRKGIGQGAWHTILINTVAPMLMAYGKVHDDLSYEVRAEELLKQLPPERHRITRLWEQEGLHLDNALATQSALALYQQWCKASKCLTCGVGKHLVRQARGKEGGLAVAST